MSDQQDFASFQQENEEETIEDIVTKKQKDNNSQPIIKQQQTEIPVTSSHPFGEEVRKIIESIEQNLEEISEQNLEERLTLFKQRKMSLESKKDSGAARAAFEPFFKLSLQEVIHKTGLPYVQYFSWKFLNQIGLAEQLNELFIQRVHIYFNPKPLFTKNSTPPSDIENLLNEITINFHLKSLEEKKQYLSQFGTDYQSFYQHLTKTRITPQLTKKLMDQGHIQFTFSLINKDYKNNKYHNRNAFNKRHVTIMSKVQLDCSRFVKEKKSYTFAIADLEDTEHEGFKYFNLLPYGRDISNDHYCQLILQLLFKNEIIQDSLYQKLHIKSTPNYYNNIMALKHFLMGQEKCSFGKNPQ